MDILEYVNSKNMEYKREGNEIILVCPQCHKQKLSINIESGVYQCFVCKAEDPSTLYAKGHISQLMESWGDIVPIRNVSDRIEPDRNQQEVNYIDLVKRYHYNLLKNKKYLKYLLIDRGITEESIDRFQLGFARRYGQDWLVIPSFQDGTPKLLKLRKFPPDTNEKLAKYIREDGSKSILFNGDVLDEYEEIIICEGEIDAISLIQKGYENVIGITAGAGSLLPEWYDLLKTKEKIYIIFDSDEAGQVAAEETWATRLGISRCWNVKLPNEYDINKYFKEHTKEDFEKIFADARQFKVDGIMSLTESLQLMYRRAKDEDNIQKYELPWPSVNKLIGGGLVRQRLTVVGGLPGVGKTSWVMETCYYLAKKYGIPSLQFCLEMPEVSLATKVVQLHNDLTIDEVNPSDALIYAMDLEGLPMYFGYAPKIKPSTFYNTMREARNRYGVQIGVFDNLQRMVRSDKESDLGIASGMFKDLVMDLNILFLLVSQPRKLNSEETPTYDSLKGSSAIPADADEVVLLHRRRTMDEGALDPRTLVIVDKSRFSQGGRTKLFFEGAKSSFREMTEDD